MPGEELFSPIEKNTRRGYMEVITPEAYQSAWNQTVRGIAIRYLGQLERIPRVLKYTGTKLEEFRSRDYALNSLSPNWLYDINRSCLGSEEKDHPIFQAHKIAQGVSLDKADFHGYWIDGIVSGNPQIKVSWYSWEKPSPYSRLLCVVNTGREAVKTGLKIDWNKLGVKPQSEFTELMSNRKMTAKELAEYKLDGHKTMLIAMGR